MNAFSPFFLAVSTKAESILPKIEGLTWLSNALVVSLLGLGIIFFLCRAATGKIAKVPGALQNVLEMLIDGIYGAIENMLGPKLARQSFPVLATMFFFILVTNWLGLIPGVGTIGWGPSGGAPFTLDPTAHIVPVLRPPGADLNMNLPLAFAFMFVWLVVVVKDNHGIKGFLAHLFAPKGKSANRVMNLFLVLIFLFVGLLEVVSISVRPFSLSIRLYGNIYAGENLLHTMSALGDSLGLSGFWAFLTRVLLPIPFYFLELLVGFLQAVVFTMLGAVYIQLSAHHEDHGEGESAAH